MESSFQAMSFPTTLWTVVLDGAGGESARAGQALAQLCQAYWYPLYSFVRRRGHCPHDAEDLTQAFFTHLLEKTALEKVDPARGRFRTFLLAALKNFLANDWDQSQARKRGGGRAIVSFDQETAENRYRLEPSHAKTPERHFERQWALALLEQVLETLGGECLSEGNAELFAALKPVLTGQQVSYAEIAAKLRRTTGAIKVAVHRLRHRYRILIRARIGETVAPDDVEDELRHLLDAVGR